MNNTLKGESVQKEIAGEKREVTHKMYTGTVKLAVPCAAWHITFSGQCLNCGWYPGVHERETL